MEIFLDNWQLILVTAVLNMLLAYLIFDSPLAKRWQIDLASRNRYGSFLGKYGMIVFYSAFLAVVVRALVEAQGEGSRITAYIGWLILAAIIILTPELSSDNRRTIVAFVFVQITSFVAYAFAIFLT